MNKNDATEAMRTVVDEERKRGQREAAAVAFVLIPSLLFFALCIRYVLHITGTA